MAVSHVASRKTPFSLSNSHWRVDDAQAQTPRAGAAAAATADATRLLAAAAATRAGRTVDSWAATATTPPPLHAVELDSLLGARG